MFDADPVFDTEDIDREIIVLELARARAREELDVIVGTGEKDVMG